MNQSAFIFIGYITISVIFLLISLATLIMGNGTTGMLILLGVVCPMFLTMYHLITTKPIDGLNLNLKRLIIKSIFMIAIVLVGINILELPATPFSIAVGSIFILSHVVEGVYALSFINESKTESRKTEVNHE